MKHLKKFNSINENYTPSNRNYGAEIAAISKDVEKELLEALKYCVENVFEKEDFGNGQYWYKLPQPITLYRSNYEEDYYDFTEYLPAGEHKTRTSSYTVPEGGFLYGESSNGREAEVSVMDFDNEGLIPFLEFLREWSQKERPTATLTRD